jgi:hypothetical protein
VTNRLLIKIENINILLFPNKNTSLIPSGTMIHFIATEATSPDVAKEDMVNVSLPSLMHEKPVTIFQYRPGDTNITKIDPAYIQSSGVAAVQNMLLHVCHWINKSKATSYDDENKIQFSSRIGVTGDIAYKCQRVVTWNGCTAYVFVQISSKNGGTVKAAVYLAETTNQSFTLFINPQTLLNDLVSEESALLRTLEILKQYHPTKLSTSQLLKTLIPTIKPPTIKVPTIKAQPILSPIITTPIEPLETIQTKIKLGDIYLYQSDQKTITKIEEIIEKIDVFSVKNMLRDVHDQIASYESNRYDIESLEFPIKKSEDIMYKCVKFDSYRGGSVYAFLQISMKDGGTARVVIFVTNTRHHSGACFGTTPTQKEAQEHLNKYLKDQERVLEDLTKLKRSHLTQRTPRQLLARLLH